MESLAGQGNLVLVTLLSYLKPQGFKFLSGLFITQNDMGIECAVAAHSALLADVSIEDGDADFFFAGVHWPLFIEMRGGNAELSVPGPLEAATFPEFHSLPGVSGKSHQAGIGKLFKQQG